MKNGKSLNSGINEYILSKPKIMQQKNDFLRFIIEIPAMSFYNSILRQINIRGVSGMSIIYRKWSRQLQK